MNAPIPRERLELFAALLAETKKREDRAKQAKRGGLIEFVRYFWDILEPETPLVEGWALESICLHLEAVTFGDIKRLLINVPPGFMKSLLTDVLWPAWEWGPMDMAHLRYVAFSYSAGLTERDNGRFRDLIMSERYQTLWGHRFEVRKVGEVRITNSKTGWKLATSVGGIGTGERGDRAIVDDPHNIKDGESEPKRTETVRWFDESLRNRLNDLRESVIIVIMQRVHEADVSGFILEQELPYVHLCIPMEYEPERHCETAIGWSDPRSELGELAWPERFPPEELAEFRRRDFMWAGQYQQRPAPRGGGIIKSDWWKPWPSETYPQCEYVLASLDTAYTEKQENDASALTIWGLFRDSGGNPKVMLLYAWEGRLAINDLVIGIHTLCSVCEKSNDELERAASILKLEQVPRFPVDRLLIETKASGISVIQELHRLYSGRGDFGVEGVDPSKWGDKTARLYAVQHMFSDEMIYYPENRRFADMVMSQVSSFPKGAHDDLVDSTSLALRYLRLSGLLQRRDEYARDVEEQSLFRSREKPLYW